MKVVAPFTGAWIEICNRRAVDALVEVAPFTGAWIEIKPYRPAATSGGRRTLHGCVD